ncbi:hypothetical protein B566_EDAN003080 [Ephemera danica]|nr:hypothetical protein B566_EDAN003080 [Ephemera danica]
MGRLRGALQMTSVHYRKLVNELGGSLEALQQQETSLHCCCKHCGAPQIFQAEQLNSIVGNAFRMAYAAQLTRQPSPFGELIGSPSAPGTSSPAKATSTLNPSSTQQHEEMNLLALANNNNNNNHNNGLTNNQNNSNSSTPTKQFQQRHTWAKTMAGRAAAAAAAAASSDSNKLQSPAKPGSLPGLRSCSPRLLAPASPESDESNSPTELNCARRVGDKPPLVKRLGAVGLVSPSPPPPREENGDEPTSKPLDPATTLLDVQAKRSSQTSPASNSAVGDEFRSKRSSQTSSASSGGSSSGPMAGLAGSSRGPSPPPLPERSDSLGARAEEEERAALHAAPWFQAGIPREIALEVLGQEPVGAFMVRESTTKPGCYALSLRVPRDFQPAGIAHYLIMRTARGYKIKGFTKEFTTLVALITHHSVMPELLPCPLALSRQHNPNFASSDANFADMDSDPDYSALADFRKMMADLDV